MNKINKAYSFDDVLLLPKYSSLSSKDDVDISTFLEDKKFDLPIISAPMDTVTEGDMAVFLGKEGGLGIIHRYLDATKQAEEIEYVKKRDLLVGAAIGVNGEAFSRAGLLVDAGADFLCLDVAHGHTVKALSRISQLKDSFPDVIIISGNIVTPDAARDCLDAGADLLRIGVGGGSACTTRMVAGVGKPQLSALLDIEEALGLGVRGRMISDGGIRGSGDIVKALAAGAGAVMIGGMFAAFAVAAGDVFYRPTAQGPEGVGGFQSTTSYVPKKKYRGMASRAALEPRKFLESFVPEGEEFEIDVIYNYNEIVAELREGIKLGLAYLGAHNIEDMGNRTEFVEVSSLGFADNLAHYGGKK